MRIKFYFLFIIINYVILLNLIYLIHLIILIQIIGYLVDEVLVKIILIKLHLNLIKQRNIFLSKLQIYLLGNFSYKKSYPYYFFVYFTKFIPPLVSKHLFFYL